MTSTHHPRDARHDVKLAGLVIKPPSKRKFLYNAAKIYAGRRLYIYLSIIKTWGKPLGPQI